MERLERAEAGRRVTDELEEARRLEHRTATLEASRRQLVHDTDKMKMLRSQRMIVHDDLVRQKQLAHKRRRREAEAARSSHYHEALMGRVAVAAEADRAAHAAAQAKAREVQSMLHEQLEEAKEAARRRAAEERAAGKKLRRDAEAAAAAEAAAEESRRSAQRRNNAEMLRANQQLREMKSAKRDEVAKEDEALQRYKDEKEALQTRRRDFVAAKRAAAEARAAEMRAIIEGRFKAAMADEGAKLDAQQQASRDKQDAAAASKASAQASLGAEIDASRRQQVERRRKAREAAKAEDRANAEKWGGVVHGLAVEEYEAEMGRRERAKVTMRENRSRAAARAGMLMSQEAKEKEADCEALGVVVHGDAGFVHDAEALLESERRAGRPTDFIARSIARSLKEPMIPAGSDM